MSIEKIVDPWCVSEGEPVVVPLFDEGMDKVASSMDNCPRIQNYMESAQPEDGWYTLLLHAVGTNEVWGPNRKADAFPEAHLVPSSKTAGFGYTSFENGALGYIHHRNTPDRWTGKVVLAEFNRPMGRVELVTMFNRDRLLKEGGDHFVEALDSDKLPAVSMGCRVPYDVCTICGNKAPNITQYCDHLKYEKNAIYPDGRKVAMINVEPRFHDISLVSTPADRAARALLKVAEHGLPEKSALMTKRIPAQAMGSIRTVTPVQRQALDATSSEPDIPYRRLFHLSRRPLMEVTASLTRAGIILRPHEFATLALLKRGSMALSEDVYDNRVQFSVFNIVGKSPWLDSGHGYDYAPVIKEAADLIPGRSVYIPAFVRRSKTASNLLRDLGETWDEGWIPEDIKEDYSAYRKTAEDLLLSGTAVKYASERGEVLTAVSGFDIPVTQRWSSLDGPRELFVSLVLGGYLPTNISAGG